MTDKFPLVVYDAEGNKRVVGSAEFTDEGQILAEVTDPDVAKKLRGDIDKHLSVQAESPPTTRHNIFNPDKKD